VLDLTRVIAGPVATRTLAALGADVLRIDPPQSPELELSVRDGCVGKRLATLDFRADLATLHELLAGAHVLIHGYRPGALTAFGLDDAALAERHPHLTVASLSSWGSVGPWSDRRGFDSLVQSASGIAWREGAGADTDGDAGVRPGTLPAQALDHATGYLLAAAVLRSLACRRRGEESASPRFALAATAAELMLHPAPDVEAHAADAEPWLTALDGVTLVAPPGELSGHRLRWPHGPRPVAPGWPAG
jgi:crotonobetainyl-CoA:carnitine CoA-transferase CaiB-like acyl-CoA transferase